MPDWSYSGDPTVSTRDQVRFLIGDTDSTDQQLLDKEIDWLLIETGTAPNAYEAAIAACTTLAARYSRKANKTTGDLSISSGDIAKHYRDLKADLRQNAMRHSVPVPYSAGMRDSDRDIDSEDDDMVQPEFRVGMDDNPGGTSEINGFGFTQVVPGA